MKTLGYLLLFYPYPQPPTFLARVMSSISWRCIMLCLITFLNSFRPMSTSLKTCYSQPRTPPYWCIRIPPPPISEPHFPHLASHKDHSYVLYNLIPDIISPMSTHPFEQPHVYYLHFLDVCILDWSTLYHITT